MESRQAVGWLHCPSGRWEKPHLGPFCPWRSRVWALNLGANPDSAALSPCPWATDLSSNLGFLTCHKAIVTMHNCQMQESKLSPYVCRPVLPRLCRGVY